MSIETGRKQRKATAILLVFLMLPGLIMPAATSVTHAADTRGDITFVRVKENTFDRLPNDAFKLTNTATGEYHILVTDANGEFSTANTWHAHSDNTNGNDAAYDPDTGKIIGTLSGPSGIWFSEEGTGTVAVGTAGALPAGTYTLDEIECTANQGLELVTGVQITISDTRTVDLGALTARTITLDGDAVDYDTDLKRAFARDSFTIEDTVDYDGVVQGENYSLTGKLVDKATGDPIKVGGQEITTTKEFTATGIKGNVVLDFTFDASSLRGTDIVVFTYLYKDGLLFASHEELTDSSQTIEILDPQLTSEAVNDETGNHLAAAEDEVSITATIKYTDLIGGNRYTLTTALVNEEGKELASNTRTIHPNLPQGSVTENLSFDATGYEGKTVIMTQELSWDGRVIATHDDLTDAKQQVRFPAITTSVADDKSKDRVALAAEGIRLIDTVSYKNVYEGTEIKLIGTLMDKDTGKVFKRDGDAVTAEAVFTPDNRNGTQDVVFEFDGPDLENKTLVVYEELFTEDNFLTDHKDISDAKQTMRFPEMTTLASDSETEDHIAFADGQVKVTDKISYKNLLPGREYSISGTLADADTEDALQNGGADITASGTFTPSAEDGTASVTYTFDATGFEGLTAVAFEQVSLNGAPVAVHEDASDKKQQVNFPKIGTSAAGTDTMEHIVLADKNAKITDTVVYENLLPDKEYVLTGTLMNADTGDAIKNGGKNVTATARFTPKNANGSAKVNFVFDASALKGETVVVFEELSFKGNVVGQHKDAADTQQQVQLPKVLTSALNGKTNDRIMAAEKDAVIVDTIEYSNVIAGKEYTVKGRLIDKATNSPVLAGGKEIEATGTFTATGTGGTTQVTFNFDATKLSGKTVVVFETLYLNGQPVGLHNDINDANQTIKFPTFDTVATDSETTDHVSAADDSVTIRDRVEFDNVIAGQEYTLTGVIYDAETNAPLEVNGQQVTATETFTSDTVGGTKTLSFTFDATGLEGKRLVVFQTLMMGQRLIAEHKDINDEDQSIYLPSVSTSAKGKTSGGSMELASEKTGIIDSFQYRSLAPDTTYTLNGVLMDAETGEEIKVNGKTVTASRNFKPASSSGTVPVEFSFDARSLAGKSIVVFETLKLGGVTVASHEDPDDTAQTVLLPKITKAEVINTETQDRNVTADDSVSLKDSISFANLSPDESYEVTAFLADRDTGEPLKDAKGEPIRVKKTFTPEGSTGDITADFAFDGSNLGGKTAAVFASIDWKGTPVAKATSNAETRTLTFPGTDTFCVPPTETSVGTGDHMTPLIIIALALLMIAALAGICVVNQHIWCKIAVVRSR